MARKTLKLGALLAKLNLRLENSTCSPAERNAMTSMVTDLLMEADVYRGFAYLHGSEVPYGELPGIRYVDGYGYSMTADEWYDAEPDDRKAKGWKLEFPDESRRFYYVDPILSADYGAEASRLKASARGF